MEYKIITGNSLEILPTLEDESVQCVVTSPPYFGLRRYEGVEPIEWPATSYKPMPGLPELEFPGDPDCDHVWGDSLTRRTSDNYNHGFNERYGNSPGDRKQEKSSYGEVQQGAYCQTCGMWRGCLGNEPTPELYTAHIVAIFREVRRVLKSSGVCWLNLGDSYSSTGGRPQGKTGQRANRTFTADKNHVTPKGNKPKDLMLIPHRVALALQADGWWLRNDNIWWKRNAMPGSQKDRFTRDHEYVFQLTKSERYYFNMDAVKVFSVRPDETGVFGKRLKKRGEYDQDDPLNRNGGEQWGNSTTTGKTRAHRTVWDIPTASFKGAHFAVFPPALPELCIKASSRPGDVVLDPFSGAGTTGIAAVKLERRYIGIEASSEYARMSEQRIAKTTRGTHEVKDKNGETIGRQLSFIG